MTMNDEGTVKEEAVTDDGVRRFWTPAARKHRTLTQNEHSAAP
jgi:hypothetical protein